MKHTIQGPLPDNPRNLMRRAGYGETPGYKGEISYQKRVQVDKFPRYHAYVKHIDENMQINLHVDQKQASYDSGAAHGGEYDGPVVEREMDRLVSFIESLKSSGPSTGSGNTTPPTKKKSMWDFLRGV